MNKKIFLAVGAILVAMGGVSWFVWQTYLRAPPPAMATLDYTDHGNWAVFPNDPPAPVWRDGWAADVLLVLSDAEISNTHRPDSEDISRARNTAIAKARGLLPHLSGVGTVYAPLVRKTSPNVDLEAALAIYLTSFNKGRALVIATDDTLDPQSLAAIKNDPALRERFAGFLLLETPNSDVQDEGVLKASSDTDPKDTAICPEREIAGVASGAFNCLSIVNVDRKDGTYVFTNTRLTDLSVLDGWMNHLNRNVAPLAEPLGGFEEVEIIDVRRPGQTEGN